MLSQTEYFLRRTPATVRLTRRYHPLEGWVLEVVIEGRTQVVVRLDDGTTMRIPRAWTDADAMPGEPAGESVFTVDALRELLERVAVLRHGA